MLADAHHISSLGYLWFSKERKLEVVNLRPCPHEDDCKRKR